MGYQLPIQPIQSQMYANRMELSTYNFAQIDRLGPVQMTTGFSDQMKEQALQSQTEDEEMVTENKDSQTSSFTSAVPYKAFIQPNPANLSPTIAKVVGKGIQVNAYV